MLWLTLGSVILTAVIFTIIAVNVESDIQKHRL